MEDIGYINISRGKNYGKTQRRLYLKKSLKDIFKDIEAYTHEHMEHIPESIGSIYSPAYPPYTQEHRQHILTSIPNNTNTNSIKIQSNNTNTNTLNNTENYNYKDLEAQRLVEKYLK